jgi:hypothetical protein
MGVDVVFKARPFTPLPSPAYRELRAAFHEAFPDDMPEETARFPAMRWDEFEPVPTIEVISTARYYGPGYERGHWPNIKEMGDWLAIRLGELAELRYGGDSADEWECLRPWGEVRSENDALWDEHGNEPYDAFWRNRGYG